MPMFARRLLYALVAAAALTLLTGSSLVRAQDSFHDVQYLAGHEGYDRKLYGHLVITDTAVIFTKVDARNTPIFSIPIASITDVSVATDRKDASVGSKIMFGFLSRSRKDELVQLTTETSDAAEGLVFKVGKNQSTGVAAKIRFRMKRAGVLAQVADPNATPSGGASNATSPGGELHSDPAVHQNAPENPQRDLPRSARQDPASGLSLKLC